MQLGTFLLSALTVPSILLLAVMESWARVYIFLVNVKNNILCYLLPLGLDYTVQ